MPKVSETFQSFINKNDIPAGGVNVEIVAVYEEAMPRGGAKFVMEFAEFPRKPLPFGKQVAMTCAELFAEDEMTLWVGKSCNLYIDSNVKFDDERVGGIRIRSKQ
jgi:hypothetical protein